MASAAPSVDGAGDDKPPEIAPADLTSPDPAADPQRNGDPPAPPSGDDGTSATEIPDPARAECGAKRPRPVPSRPGPCRKCARRKMILRGTDPAPQSDDESSAALPSASPPLTVPDPGALGAKKGTPSPTATTWCGPCEFRKKIHNDMLLRRNREAPAPPAPGTFMHVPPDADMAWVMRQTKLWEPPRAPKRRAKERPPPAEPLTAEQERGYRECDVGKKLMRHKWDGLHHKWGGMRRISKPPKMARDGAADGGANLLAKLLAAQEYFKEPPPGAGELMRKDWAETCGLLDRIELSAKELVDLGDKKLPLPQGQQKGLLPAPKLDGLDFTCTGIDPLASTRLGVRKPLRVDDAKLAPPQVAQKGLRQDSAWEMAGFGAISAGRRSPLENTMLSVQKALRVDDAKLAPPQGPRNPSSSAAARVDVLHDKLAQMTKVLTKVLHEAGVLQVSMKLLRLLCPDVGSSAAAGGGLDGNDWGLVEEAIDNLVNQTGEGMQDIVKTVIPKVFSKEVLYDLIMSCVGRYPKLLEDDKGKLTTKKYEQYQKQLDLMVNLTTVYDNDPENFPKIMKLMCKIGGCGPLPSEVIDDISPGLDPSTMEQLYSGMLELLHNVDRASPVDTNPCSE